MRREARSGRDRRRVVFTNVDAAFFSCSSSSRVRSLIIQQEKAQDREKLLLKFIKIMKVGYRTLKNAISCAFIIAFNIYALFITALKKVE